MEVFNLAEELEKERKKNKELERQLEYLRSGEYLNQVKWERDLNEKIVEDLNNIIDKAIEYIESYLPNYDFDKTNLGELLNILKGDNK